jgi:hypothetical protein
VGALRLWREADGEDALLTDNTDRLYGDFRYDSHLLPAARPWLYRIGDLVRVGNEVVQILDGFLHVRREVGSMQRSHAPAGSSVLIIRACSEGSSL